MFFPVVMYRCKELDSKEGWELKNWCFQTVVLEKTVENPSDSKDIKPVNPKGNQPWIFTGRTKLQYYSHLMQGADSLKKFLMLGKIQGKRRARQRMRQLDSITNSMDMNLNKLYKDSDAMCATVHGVTKSRTWLREWTTTGQLVSVGLYFFSHLFPSFIPPCLSSWL